SPHQTTQLAINTLDIPQMPYGVVSGNMKVAIFKKLSYLIDLRINVYNKGIIQVNTFRFPGWKVFIDGKEVKKFIKNRLDLIQVEVPAGNHHIVVEFTNTPIRVIANSISLITIIILFGFVTIMRNKKI
ncbi:MAG TPA: hypothetical protein VEW42_00540, partial [Candidatus Eisenbacteria bacterium]|nr:hypothetical protein [Candidatus Eisenbacteria bacterium]